MGGNGLVKVERTSMTKHRMIPFDDELDKTVRDANFPRFTAMRLVTNQINTREGDGLEFGCISRKVGLQGCIVGLVLSNDGEIQRKNRIIGIK